MARARHFSKGVGDDARLADAVWIICPPPREAPEQR